MRSVEAHRSPGRFIGRAFCLGALLLPSLVVSTPAHAETGAESPGPRSAPVAALLHDDRAIAEWLKQRHHDVLAAEARIAQARADVGTARLLLPNPALDFTLGGLQVGPSNKYAMPTPNGFGELANYNIGLTQTIELGKRGPRIEAAELRAQESGKTFLDTVGDRVSVARTALAKVAYLKAKMTVLEDNLAGAKRVAELEKARLEHGALSGNDYDRLLLDNISLEADIARAHSDFESALSACGQTMLATCDAASAQLADVDAAAPVPGNVAGMGDAIEKRPDVQAAKLEEQAAQKDAVLAERRAIPDPQVRVGFTHDSYFAGGSQPNAFQITLTVPLPIFDHGQHDAAKARARALEQRHVASGIVVGARSDFAGLLSRKMFLESAMHTLDTVAVPKSTAILDATSKAFDQGQVSMTDLLLARRTHLALVQNQMDMHFEFFGVRNDIRHTLSLDTTGMSAPDRAAPAADKAEPSSSRAARPVTGKR